MNSDPNEPDEPLRRALSDFPPTPRTITQKLQRRVRRPRLLQTRILLSSIAALVAICFSISTLGPQASSLPMSSRASSPQDAIFAPLSSLDAATLDRLFAIPPVDSLAVLDHRLDAASHVLKLKENRQ